MDNSLVQRIGAFCQKHTRLAKDDKVVVGVSGGPDSVCLLHVLHMLCSNLNLTLYVAHLNHQLRGAEAQADEAYVRQIASRWQIPILVETSDITTLAAQRQQSIEETARQVRYGFLWRVAHQVNASYIAVGHNADDQVETVLMHLLRGTGLAGLRGMLPVMDIANLRLPQDDVPPSTPVSSPHLIRPLLETSRRQIETYCHQHQLSPRQDASNLDTTFFRNRLRHELIPYLETYNPNIRQILQRTAKVIAAEVEILSAHLDQAWPEVIPSASPAQIEFKLATWLELPLALKRSTLRRAVQTLRHNYRDINFEHIDTAITLIEKGGVGSQATLPQGLLLTLSYQTFTIASPKSSTLTPVETTPYLAPGVVVALNLPGLTALPQTNWQLKATFLPAEQFDLHNLPPIEPWEAYLDADALGHSAILRTRQVGDMIAPLGLGGRHQKVTDFMINAKIPAARRNYIPLLVAANQLCWICGYRLDERARLKSSTRRVLHLRFEQ
jgi:tRNA(Ile)-lysidine synthase